MQHFSLIKQSKLVVLTVAIVVLITNCKNNDSTIENKKIFTFDIANNKQINSTSKDSVEFYFVNWIKDSTKIVDKTTWFDFDELLFDARSSKLKQNSELQLKNIAAILNSYPNVKLKIGAYTDSLEVKNDKKMELSAQRANAVKADLVALGINPERLKPEGYGDLHQVTDNKTEENCAINRRIAIRITNK